MHELRHAYQWEAAHYNRHVVTNATREAWRENMPPNYIEPIVVWVDGDLGGYYSLENIVEYRRQPIEFDAMMFAMQTEAIQSLWNRSASRPANRPEHYGSWQSQWMGGRSYVN